MRQEWNTHVRKVGCSLFVGTAVRGLLSVTLKSVEALSFLVQETLGTLRFPSFIPIDFMGRKGVSSVVFDHDRLRK